MFDTGIDRLCLAVHGRCALPGDQIGGDDAPLQHAAADRIHELKERIAELEGMLTRVSRALVDTWYYGYEEEATVGDTINLARSVLEQNLTSHPLQSEDDQ